MALPATDNFNRADAGTLGSNWTVQTAEADIGITGNVASNKSATVINGDFWNADAFADDQKSEATMVKMGGGNNLELSVRCRCSGSVEDYYGGGRNDHLNPDDRHLIWKIIAATRTELAGQVVAWVVNDIARLEAVGTGLELFVNGTSELTATDTSLSSGSAGIGLRSAGGGGAAVDEVQLDDWTGDDISGGDVFLDGTAAAVSSLSGVLPVDREMVSAVSVVSSLSGDLPVSRLMVSTVAAASSLAGALPVDKGLSSTIPATSNLAGALALEWALAGIVPAVSTLTGDLTVPGEIVLSGVIPATSTLSGQLPVERLMVSTVAAVSTLDAILGKYRAIAGSIDAASTLAGNLQRLRALAGAIAGGSTLAGALKLQWALRGVLAGTSVVSGDLTGALGFPWTRERLLTAKDISGPALRAPHRKEIE